MTTKFQVLCCCLRCKKETTSGQLTRAHTKDRCPIDTPTVRFPGNYGRTAWNKGLSINNDERVAKHAEQVSKTRKENPVYLTQEQKDHLSAIAKAKGFGGYRENAGRSKKFKVLDSYGKETVLQSTYELKCSEILNELGIKWLRPKALKYDNRNYFADFYLPVANIYLDPKNNYKAKLDTEKINKVIEQNNVRVVILLEEHLTKEYINQLCS